MCSVPDVHETCHEGPEGEKRYSSTLPLTSTLDGGGWLTPRPARFTPGKETRQPFYRRLGGPQVQSGRVRKISLRPDFFFCVFSCTLYFISTFFLSWLSCILPVLKHITQPSMPRRDFIFSLSVRLLSFAVQNTQHKHSCPRRDSNPHSQQAIGRRPSP